MIPEQDPTIVEISATLEQIQRTNQMLAYHKQFEDVDTNAVENYERLRDDFLLQLGELLKELKIDVTVHKQEVA